MHAKNNGEKISNKVRFNAYEMLRATGRKTGGVEYRRLGDAFLRLTGTVFKTDVKTGGKRETRFFSMLDSGSGFVFKDDERMRLDFCEVVLSEWVMRSIEANEVVTISNDYFQLRKPLERRIYELARKHCGNQKQWKIGLSNLKTKTGSNSPLKLFRHKIRKLIEQDHIPFYRFELDENDNVVFRPRKPATEYRDAIKLPQWAEDKARDILVKKNLSYQWYLEEWLDFAAAETAKGNPPKDAGAAFVAYCQKLKGQR
jgi:plasmid replication initiation protein